MKLIGGNINGTLETATVTENAIGEPITLWKPVQNMYGFLDLLSENKTNQTLNAFIGESTHIFICDYVELPEDITGDNTRFICEGKRYEVDYIDDPMNLHYQLEIFLKYSGWQDGS